MQHLFSLRIFFAYLILSCTLLGINPLSSTQVLAPFDLLVAQPLYQITGTENPNQIYGQRSDFLDAYGPRWRFFRENLQAGNWKQLEHNPLRGNGEPGVQLLSNGFWTPRVLLYAIFPDPIQGLNWGALIQLSLGALGAFLLLQALGLQRSLSFLGGLFFAWNGFHSSWFYWTQFSTATLLPWLLLTTLHLHRSPKLSSFASVTLSTVFLFLGGFPAVAAYGIGFCLVASAWTSLRERNSKKLLLFVGATTTAVLVLSPLFWVLREYLRGLDFGYREATRGLGIQEIQRLFSVFYKNTAPVEQTGYVGLIPILAVLFVFCLHSKLRKRFLESHIRRGSVLESTSFWGICCVLTLIVIFDFPSFVAGAFYKLPVLSSNPNGRLLSLLALEVAVLAGFALEAFAKHFQIFGRRLLVMVVVLTLLHSVDLGRLWRLQNTLTPASHYFAESPALNWLKTHAQPGSAVLSDSSVSFFPGTLTAYGFKEWHSHGFFTPDEKARLAQLTPGHNPWVTPTNAFLKAEHFAPLGDAAYKNFDIRYIIVPTRSAFTSTQKRDIVYEDSGIRILKL